MLKLATSDPSEAVHERIAQMKRNTMALRTLNSAELRALYAEIERIRDCLSLLLDKADGK